MIITIIIIHLTCHHFCSTVQIIIALRWTLNILRVWQNAM
jgi:hypothetical protein